MVWLDNQNAGPISYTYGSDGNPTPIVSNLSIAGKTWYVERIYYLDRFT